MLNIPPVCWAGGGVYVAVQSVVLNLRWDLVAACGGFKRFYRRRNPWCTVVLGIPMVRHPARHAPDQSRPDLQQQRNRIRSQSGTKLHYWNRIGTG